MKKLILTILLLLVVYASPVYANFTGPCPAGQQAGTNGCVPISDSSTNVLNQGNDITDNDLRTGNVDMNSIPQVLVSIINILLGVAGTIAVVSLIYHAVQMQLNSGITGDSSGVDKAKKGMFGSVIGFVIAILAWFIVIRFIEILSGLS